MPYSIRVGLTRIGQRMDNDQAGGRQWRTKEEEKEDGPTREKAKDGSQNTSGGTPDTAYTGKASVERIHDPKEWGKEKENAATAGSQGT